MNGLIIFISAYLLDLLIGDPRWIPHPVRFIGKGISLMERILRGQNTKDRAQNIDNGINIKERMAGAMLVTVIVGGTFVLFYLADSLLMSATLLTFPINHLSFFILIYLTSTTLATRGLIKAGQEVISAIDSDDIVEARKRLSLIVGRDTDRLDKKDILRATIESVAENTSDGIIAPMFYFAIGGLPLAMTYKAINTLDSMVGYKNEKYRDFGWASARIDDIANFIPARITGILIVITSFLINLLSYSDHLNRLNGLNSLRIMFRDGRNHPSPNSGIPEAAIAGALGVRLGGPSTYSGKIVEKPYIGDEIMASNEEILYLNAARVSLWITGIVSVMGVLMVILIIKIRGAWK